MKRFFACALSLALLLPAGCQSTPEAGIVKGKSSDALIEKAQAETGGALAQRVGAPETYEASVSSADGKLTVTIDAAVTVPEAEKVPIVRVTDGDITQEQADVIMDELVHNTLYPLDRDLTQEEIKEQILDAREKLAAGPTESDKITSFYIDGIGDVTWEEWMQHTIDKLTERYDTAPETPSADPISGKFVEDEEVSGFSSIMGSGTSDQFGFEELRIYNGPGLGVGGVRYTRSAAENDFAMHYVFGNDLSDLFTPRELSDFPALTLTPEEAAALCDALVEKLDIPHMALCRIDKKYNGGDEDAPPICCWALEYTRCFEGVPITYTNASSGMIVEQEGGNSPYQQSWHYETMTFYVNDNGIVGMEWDCPYELGETVVEDAALLGFDDTMDIFRKMYVVQMDGSEFNVTVNDIRFGYTRLLEQDKPGNGLLVPVWDFFGVEKYADGYTNDDPEHSLFTINAIDGTVIDRDTGY